MLLLQAPWHFFLSVPLKTAVHLWQRFAVRDGEGVHFCSLRLRTARRADVDFPHSERQSLGELARARVLHRMNQELMAVLLAVVLGSNAGPARRPHGHQAATPNRRLTHGTEHLAERVRVGARHDGVPHGRVVVQNLERGVPRVPCVPRRALHGRGTSSVQAKRARSHAAAPHVQQAPLKLCFLVTSSSRQAGRQSLAAVWRTCPSRARARTQQHTRWDAKGARYLPQPALYTCHLRQDDRCAPCVVFLGWRGDRVLCVDNKGQSLAVISARALVQALSQWAKRLCFRAHFGRVPAAPCITAAGIGRFPWLARAKGLEICCAPPLLGASSNWTRDS